jgi:hypothetical protein
LSSSCSSGAERCVVVVQGGGPAEAQAAPPEAVPAERTGT